MRKINIIEKLRLIHGYGIKTWVNFMLAAPESTLEDDFETINLSKEGKVTYTNYSTTVPMFGTVMYSYCVDNKLIDPSDHVSDMKGCTQPSTLNCFDQKERDVRYNIFLLGPLVARMPFPFGWVAKKAMKVFPPNRLFAWLHRRYYEYSIENQIFALHSRPVQGTRQ
jgi:radical SAM superfamily enzyme YgiQ (UPF0313 family)